VALNCPECGNPVTTEATAMPPLRCPSCKAPLRSGPLERALVIDGVIIGDRPLELAAPSRSAKNVPLIGLRREEKPRLAVWLPAASAAVLLVLAMIGFRSPITEAITGLIGGGTHEGLEFRSVRTETHRARTGRTLIVEGEIVNRSADAVALPAIKLTLRVDGADVYSWSVEPTERKLSAGSAIGFRSLIAPPDQRDGEVVASLADRRDDIVGMQ